MHYVADDKSIRDAQEEVNQAQYEIQISEIEKSISKLEEARDKETDAIDDMIDKLKEYRDSWKDITSAYAESQEDLIAAQILGSEWETDILNGRLDVLDDFKNQYISIQQAMADAAWKSANEQIKASQEAQKGASGTPSSASTISTGGDITQLGKGTKTTPSKSSSKSSTLTNTTAKTASYGSGTNNARKGLNLVGEDGTELYFDNHDNVAIVTEPTLIPMEGGEVVKNERETQKLLDQNNISPIDTVGLADLDGKEAEYTMKVNIETNGEISDAKSVTYPNGVRRLEDGTIIRPDGIVLTPLPATDPFMQMCNKFKAYMEETGAIVSKTTAQKNMEEVVKTIETINNMNNSKTQQVNIGDININCPGVTSQEVAKQIGVEVNNLFNGLHLDAYQQSKMR